MKEEFIRQTMLIGDDAMLRLEKSYVALFGVGGVGSYAAEALARAGVGKILLVDSDTVSTSNINRQLCALQSTVGKYKADVVAERLRDINPDITVEVSRLFVLPENICSFDFAAFDFVIDAVDTVSAKLAIAEACHKSNTQMISCMGTGNKLDPLAFCITDISKTNTCPLARVMRRELKKRGIIHLPVLYSTETPRKTANTETRVPASISFVPSVAGLVAASEAIKSIAEKEIF